jgi:succinoglycan biosynthesis protein ExoL
MNVSYFANDLCDPAVHRRVRMLVAGGASVKLIGFRRSAEEVRSVEGRPAVDLGRTEDGQLAKRALSVARILTKLDSLAGHVCGADAVLARNLETLVLASRAKSRYAPSAKLVYECLDVHRILLSDRLEGKLMRLLESRLWQEVDLLLTSSPAFVKN